MKIRILFCLLPLVFLFACSPKEEVDLMVFNANIYTVDSGFSTVEALVVRDGKIIATGSNADLKARFNAKDNLDAGGDFVYPGLIDAHCHFMGYAKSLKAVNLMGTKSFEEVVQRIVEFQEKNQLSFVTGRGWDQNDWEIKEFPNKAILDSLFPNIPILISRVDGHAALANQAALDYGKVRDTILTGGIVETDSAGNLTGILIDNAVDLIEVPDLEQEDLLEAIDVAQNNCFAYGLTTLDDAGLDKKSIDLIDSLQKAEALKMRMYVMVSDRKDLRDYYLKKPKIKTDKLNVRSFKFYADGALGSRGACLLNPYTDHPHSHGFLLDSVKHYKIYAAVLSKLNWQMNTHAIGDSANRAMLHIYGEAAQDKRWRIEHAQVVNESDFHLFKKFQVIPSVQPTHATSDMYWADERLGDQRIKDAYAYKRLLKEYGKIALGTDFPVEDISTIKTFYAATIRKDVEGYPEEGFQMENALTREEALKGMTIWAAYSNFEEDEKGSLESGKWADFVILDKDWINCEPDEILETKVLCTYIGGEEVYRMK